MKRIHVRSLLGIAALMIAASPLALRAEAKAGASHPYHL
jgi:hypothetical protein